MSIYIDCVNCGKQVIWEAGNDTCIWCGKSARVKTSVTEQHGSATDKLTEKLPVAPGEEIKAKIKEEKMLKGGSQHEKHLFIEEHKVEIIADFWRMTVAEFLKQWGLSLSGWLNIKKRWVADIEAAQPAGIVAQESSPVNKSVRKTPKAAASITRKEAQPP